MLTTQYIRTLLYTLITMCVSCYANDFKDELFNAILAKDLKTCKTLIKEVDVNTKDNNGWTPLDCVRKDNNPDLYEYIRSNQDFACQIL